MEFFNDLGTDPLKPSLFELVAHEQLRDLLQPALKYVLAVSTSRVYVDTLVETLFYRFLPKDIHGTSFAS